MIRTAAGRLVKTNQYMETAESRTHSFENAPRSRGRANEAPSARRFGGVSVIATVRNERDTIEAFVQSLLEQTYPPDEVIIVDGASVDGTAEILGRYQAAGRLVLISQKCNIAQGRNLAISRASGRWIAVTDAGCVVDPNWLKNLAAWFDDQAGCDVVAGNFQCRFDSAFEEAVAAATFAPGREHAEQNLYPSSRSVAFRKSAWQRAKGYPEWLYAAEDTLFTIRLRQLGLRFVFARDAYVYWRPRSSWRSLARQRFNFSRGNARIGFGTAGYLLNIRFHAAMLLPLLAAAVWPPVAALSLVPMIVHVRRNLWPQAAVAARASHTPGHFARILAVMEFVRIVNIAGFVAGKWDRLVDKSFISNQVRWMGLASAELSEPRIRGEPMPTPGDELRSGPFARLRLATAAWLYKGERRGVVTQLGTILGVAALVAVPLRHFPIGLLDTLAVALGLTGLLTAKSIKDFSQTGPQLKAEILANYGHYSVAALLRLAGFAFAITALMAATGFAVYGYLILAGVLGYHAIMALSAAIGGVAAITAFRFCDQLLQVPGTIAASSNYRLSRFYPLWEWLSPDRLALVRIASGGAAVLVILAALVQLLVGGHPRSAAISFGGLALLGVALRVTRMTDQASAIPPMPRSERPNIVMIGSDTLRADRLGGAGYARDLTPSIDRLAARGTQFTACYVPCARTAPSLLSLLTGTWPQTHGVRDNFVSDTCTRPGVETLPSMLRSQGYRTAAYSDWCGGDLGKFPLGFETLDLPLDQWNVKYLIRQGPKDLRLFLSLFTHNTFGKRFLPELYYLAGVPLTRRVVGDACREIARNAACGGPFLLNIFVSATHPPFSSEYPNYMLYSDPAYRGESKFAMAHLTDPWDIIRRQGDSNREFDLVQIIDLYDGCVRNFDNEVQRVIECIEDCGIADNTIVVVYSDHGMEFFEHDTWGQGNSVRGDFSAKIPLIIVDPRTERRSVCPYIVRSIDLAPTLLDLAGIEPLATADGVSLTPYMEPGAADMYLAAYNETGIWLGDVPGMPDGHLRYPNLFELLQVPDKRTGTLAIKREYQQAIITAKDRMVRIGPWKLIYQPTSNGPLYALFNIDSDPECRHDVAKEHPGRVRELQELLARWIGEEAGGALSATSVADLRQT